MIQHRKQGGGPVVPRGSSLEKADCERCGLRLMLRQLPIAVPLRITNFRNTLPESIYLRTDLGLPAVRQLVSEGMAKLQLAAHPIRVECQGVAARDVFAESAGSTAPGSYQPY